MIASFQLDWWVEGLGSQQAELEQFTTICLLNPNHNSLSDNLNWNSTQLIITATFIRLTLNTANNIFDQLYPNILEKREKNEAK